MKRTLRFILVTCLLLILTLSCVGCNFIANKDTSSGTTPSEQQQEETKTKEYATKVALKDSIALSSQVVYPKNTRSEKPFGGVADVIENKKIDRASVNIMIYASSTSYAMGSGVIIDIDDGIDNGDKEDNIFYIITCQHVIENYQGKTIKVYVPDDNGRQYDEASYNTDFTFTGTVGGEIDFNQAILLVGGDRTSDIALLRLYVADDTLASKIVKASIIDEDNSIRLGESVIAIGNSEGEHPGHVTDGIISDLYSQQLIEDAGNMILWETSANIYPGNSGGGLFNMYGELIGITNAGETITDVTGDTTSKGINFVIPVKTDNDSGKDNGFRNIAKQLLGTFSSKNYGYISNRKLMLGITTQAYSNNEVKVIAVTSGSLAERAGIRKGDTVDGIKLSTDAKFTVITSSTQIGDLIYSAGVGDVIVFNLRRNNGYSTDRINVEITLMQYFFCDTGDYTGIEK